MTLTIADLLVASSPIVVLLSVLGWRYVPTLLEWQRERQYQVEWQRTLR